VLCAPVAGFRTEPGKSWFWCILVQFGALKITHLTFVLDMTVFDQAGWIHISQLGQSGTRATADLAEPPSHPWLTAAYAKKSTVSRLPIQAPRPMWHQRKNGQPDTFSNSLNEWMWTLKTAVCIMSGWIMSVWPKSRPYSAIWVLVCWAGFYVRWKKHVRELCMDNLLSTFPLILFLLPLILIMRKNCDAYFI